VPGWTFLSSHARVLMCIAGDPDIRLRDLADSLSITERRAYGIISDLVSAGYVVKGRVGRRNRYRVQTQLPFPEAVGPERSLGEVLETLVGSEAPSAPDSTESGVR
jgi:hypothetical protein